MPKKSNLRFAKLYDQAEPFKLLVIRTVTTVLCKKFFCHTLKFPNYHLIFQGACLFEPRSIPVNKLVFNKSIEVWGGKHVAWIGINDKNVEGEFVFTSSREKVTVTDWYTGEPNNNGDSEDCIVFGFYHYNRKWNDVPCSNTHSFICEVLS